MEVSLTFIVPEMGLKLTEPTATGTTNVRFTDMAFNKVFIL